MALLAFAVDGAPFAVDLGRVREVLAGAPVTRVPLVPASLRGVVNVRGAVLPVLDVGARLGARLARIDGPLVLADSCAGRCALLVERVIGILEVPPAALRDRPATGPLASAECVCALAPGEGAGFVPVLDVDVLLDERGIELARPASRPRGAAVPPGPAAPSAPRDEVGAAAETAPSPRGPVTSARPGLQPVTGRAAEASPPRPPRTRRTARVKDLPPARAPRAETVTCASPAQPTPPASPAVAPERLDGAGFAASPPRAGAHRRAPRGVGVGIAIAAGAIALLSSGLHGPGSHPAGAGTTAAATSIATSTAIATPTATPTPAPTPTSPGTLSARPERGAREPGADPRQTSPVAPIPRPQARTLTVTVRRGDTLWDLARRLQGTPYAWPRLHRANASDIPDPDRIEPGQRLVVPAAR